MDVILFDISHNESIIEILVEGRTKNTELMFDYLILLPHSHLFIKWIVLFTTNEISCTNGSIPIPDIQIIIILYFSNRNGNRNIIVLKISIYTLIGIIECSICILSQVA